MSLFDVRSDYDGSELRKRQVDPDPVAQFRLWMSEAIEARVPEPTAMTLATASEEGAPGARMVLLKQFDEQGFVFFTNYDSRKARELDENPQASLLFFWEPLHRQVRIEGRATKTSREESEAYFAGRPRDSRIGAWASPQSTIIENRDALMQRFEETAARYPHGAAIPTPPDWGGFRVEPASIEFWQGRPGRLHDRILYTRGGSGQWVIHRLAP